MPSKTEESESLNYFTCTLGTAALMNANRVYHFSTITQFIDLQAQRFPNLPAVGFPGCGREGGFLEESPAVSGIVEPLFTFEGLSLGSMYAARLIKDELSRLGLRDHAAVWYDSFGKKIECVALLSPSSESFLFMWLGLIRLGYVVLLIAPQCSPEAITHLCSSCKVTRLYYDKSYEDLVSKSTIKHKTCFTRLLSQWLKTPESMISMITLREEHMVESPQGDSFDLAYYFHTSGTSGGLPKAIGQTHAAAVGFLPSFDGSGSATFTPTPLYHGGIADCFRAWTSRALIYVFPAANIPITSENIVKCLALTKKTSDACPWVPRVKYFSSVPYILQDLSENSEGLTWLQGMDIVGVGGAALPSAVGNKLVAQRINLVSRFGSTECGFVLCSNRNYDIDKDWDYLRVPRDSESLEFSLLDDGSGLAELVMQTSWPYIASPNHHRANEFKTNDLFEPHPSIPGAWRYHSRADSQITLLTGKKFDPAPVEDALCASSSWIRNVVIFGNGKHMPGALVFPSAEGDLIAEDKLLEGVFEALENLNTQGQEHTKISKDMVVVMPYGTKELPKSSKGTVLRRIAEKEYKKEIESVYDEDEPLGASAPGLGRSAILGMVRRVVSKVVENGIPFKDEDDFYLNGINSAKATQIRHLLQKEIRLPRKLRWNVVYTTGNIKNLSKHLFELHNGREGDTGDDPNLITHLMKNLVQKAGQDVLEDHGIPARKNKTKGHTGISVLLTGATGVLGANILEQLLCCPEVVRVICLVRGPSDTDVQNRVKQNLKKRLIQIGDLRWMCLAADLGKKDLGILSHESYDYLMEFVDVIIHAAWNVNFSLPLEAFIPDQIAGLTNLLTLSMRCHKPVRFVFCSSTASMLGTGHPSLISETISSKPVDAAPIGYGRSKWVAEGICAAVGKAISWTGGDSIVVARIGQLTASTETGVWNMTEAWPLLLQAGVRMKCLPMLEEPLSWLPVNIAAMTVAEIALRGMLSGDVENIIGKTKVKQDSEEEVEEKQGCEVYHIVSNSTDSHWVHLLQWLCPRWGCTVVEKKAWLKGLEDLAGQEPAKALLGFWRVAWGVGDDGDVVGDPAGVGFGGGDGAAGPHVRERTRKGKGKQGMERNGKGKKKKEMKLEMEQKKMEVAIFSTERADSVASTARTSRTMFKIDGNFVVQIANWLEGVILRGE